MPATPKPCALRKETGHRNLVAFVDSSRSVSCVGFPPSDRIAHDADRAIFQQNKILAFPPQLKLNNFCSVDRSI